MQLKHFDYWIFDLDGTLTLPVHDFDSIRSELRISAESPILEAIQKMSPEDAAATRNKLHNMEMDLALKAQPQPGVDKILNTLKRRGKKMAILTRNDEEIGYITLKAAGLDHYFGRNSIIGRETCAPKPQPDGVHFLLDMWEAPKHLTLIIGDYLFDIQAGFKAGISTVHFDFRGEFLWPEFTSFGILQMKEILSMI